MILTHHAKVRLHERCHISRQNEVNEVIKKVEKRVARGDSSPVEICFRGKRIAARIDGNRIVTFIFLGFRRSHHDGQLKPWEVEQRRKSHHRRKARDRRNNQRFEHNSRGSG